MARGKSASTRGEVHLSCGRGYLSTIGRDQVHQSGKESADTLGDIIFPELGAQKDEPG